MIEQYERVSWGVCVWFYGADTAGFSRKNRAATIDSEVSSNVSVQVFLLGHLPSDVGTGQRGTSLFIWTQRCLLVGSQREIKCGS